MTLAQPSTDGQAIAPPWFGRDLPATIRFYAEARAGAASMRNRHAVRRWLAQNDLYYLLVYVCGRRDMLHPWIFDRCREVQLAPDGHLDLWARDHYKALDENTPTLTARGWVRHGDLRTGDLVYAPDGRLTPVIATTGTLHGAECFDLALSCGARIVAAGDHIWRSPTKHRPRTKAGRAVRFRDRYLDTYQMSTGDRLPRTPTLRVPTARLPIDPYTLGCWLGDGHAADGRITCADDIWRHIPYPLSRPGLVRTIYGLRPKLRRLGVLDNKHVPNRYLRAGPEQRRALLQGLLDTDGSAHRVHGQVIFCNTNPHLVEAVAFLARSLGAHAHVRPRQNSFAGYFQVSMQPTRADRFFRVARKLAACHDLERRQPHRYVRRKSRVQSRPVNCIQVLGGEYLAGTQLVPTHNSTIITFGLSLAKIISDPEITSCILSHTRPIAKGFLKQIKREAESNRDLIELFPDVFWEEPIKQAPMWSEDGGLIFRRQSNPKEATLEAWGLIDGQPTSKHFKDRDYDDVVTRESVTSPEMIRKTMEAFELSGNLGSEGGTFRAVGTRYNLYDPYATILERGVLKPRIYPATDDGTLAGKPVLFGRKRWAEAKKLQSSTIAAQLLLDPRAAGQATFEAQWLRGFEVRPRTLNVYIMGDPSMGPSARGRDTDSCALAVVGISATRARYLLDGMCHRMALSERWSNLRNLYWKWKNTPGVMMCAVGYERYGLQADLEYFEEKMRAEGKSFDIAELSWTREGQDSKEARIERLEPWFRNSQFFVPAFVDPSFADPDEEGERFPYAAWYHDKNKIVRRGVKGAPGAWEKAEREGVADLIQKPIRRLDEEKRLYDLTLRFFDQYLTHPVGAHDDLIDAASRIEDMDPVPPMIVSEAELRGPDYDDA